MRILTTPDPLLRRVALPVKSLDKKLQTEIDNMLKALKSAKDPEGVGLAATQVGLNRRLFIIIFNGITEIFINPVLSKHSKAMISEVHTRDKDRWLEGCLSVPRLWGFVDRHYSVEVEYLTPVNNELVSKHRKFEDADSSYIQHENDHLDGILFTDRILEQGGTIMKETSSGLAPIEM